MRTKRRLITVITALVLIAALAVPVLSPTPALAADGSGICTVTPTGVATSSTGNTLTFTFTAAENMGSGSGNDGYISITMPSGWSAPQGSSGSAAGYTTAPSGSLSFSGQTVTCTFSSLDSGSPLTVVYGSGGGTSGATAQSTTGTATFLTKSQINDSGSLVEIASSPQVTVCDPPTCTGWQVPSANAAVAGAGDGNGFETSPGNAYVDDSTFAENIDNGADKLDGDQHIYSAFGGFTIPANNCISGIEVRLDWYLDSNSGSNGMIVDLSWDGGTSWSAVSIDSEPTSEATVYLGGCGDLWNHSWTESELSNANFQVRLTCISDYWKNRDFYLDYLAVRVCYCECGTCTGWTNPSSNSGTAFDTDPTYAYANEGDGYAYNDNGRYQSHTYYDYGLSIPAGATINGIQVRLDWWLSSTRDTNYIGVDLSWDGGNSWTSTKSASTERTDDGNPTDVLGDPCCSNWGHNWTAAELNNDNFRVRLYCYSSSDKRDFYLDWVPVSVCYTEPAPPVPGDYGDAPEGAIAYLDATMGQFPTCVTTGPAGWIYHGIGPPVFFGFPPAISALDFETDGNAGTCAFPPYDQDECGLAVVNPDSGLLWPQPYTIVGSPGSESIATCPDVPYVTPYLGQACQTAVWSFNVDIWVTTDVPAFVNVLIDWNQDGMWGGSSTCSVTPVPEHVLVNFPVPVGSYPLSAWGPPSFQIGPNGGYVWARFTISDIPVPPDWDGSGEFAFGETEDYLLRVQCPAIHIDKTATEASVEAGQTIHYTYQVTNGDTGFSLTGVTVSDPTCTPTYQDGDDNSNGTLDDYETWRYTCDYVTTLADLATGFVLNEATAIGTPPGLPSVQDTDTETVTVTRPTAEDNPALAESCGMDVVLVLDSSDSISNLDSVRNLANVFVDALMPAIPTAPNLIGVVEFDTNVVPTSLDLTNSKTNVQTRISGIIHVEATELTNWEAGLTEARKMLENDGYSSDRDDSLHPDLIILISNGEPTTYGYPTSLGSYGLPEPDDEDIDSAIIAANAAKTSTSTGPIRILYAGVSGTTTYGQQVSGPNIHPPTANSITIDAITADFSALAGILAAQANQCFGTIIVDKVTDPSGESQSFTFTTTGAGYSGFSLTDAAVPNNQTLVPGTYNVTETVPGGWTLTSVNCTGGTCTDITNGVSINLASGENVTCTFNNTKLGSITIEKETDPNGSTQSFNFTGTPGSFNLSDGESEPFIDLLPGTYNFTETVPGDWTLTSVNCTGGTCTDITNGVSINLASGENVTCTFNNTQLGSITIVKNAIPDDDQDFAFTSDLGPFTLDDDGGTNATNSNTKTSTNLAPGTYNVTETVPGGWNLTNISFTGDDGNSSSSDSTATIVLDPGESVTVKFTNTKEGSIIVVKDAVPDDEQNFTFTSTTLNPITFDLDDDADATLSNTKAFTNLAPGTYNVTETVPGGWNLTNISFTGDDGNSSSFDSTATIVLDPGESVTVKFTNTKKGHILVDKVTDPSGDSQSFEFSPSYGSSFSLADTSTPNDSGALVPGTYNVTETVPSGWDLTNINIVDPDGGSSFDLGTKQATIDLDPGESVTVKFTNTKKGSITIKKQTLPDGGTGFSFTDNVKAPNSFSLNDDQTETLSNVLPGTYTITESSLPTDWDLTSIVCDDANSTGDVPTATATIKLEPGETVTCTFTNQQRIPPASIDIYLTKTATDGAGHKVNEVYVGDTIVYVFEVLNTGYVDFTSVLLTDDTGICNTGTMTGPTGDDGDGKLNPSEIWKYTCSHVVTAGDPDPLDNTAMVSGTPSVPGTLATAEATSRVRIIIGEGPVPVGGTVVPVDKAAILAPWIALFVAIALGAIIL